MQTPEDNISLVKAQLSEDFNLPVTKDKEELAKALAEGINQLIQTDFARLINMLYRIDISEKVLKETLEQQADEDAGLLIARLIIERLLQKQQIRAQFKTHDNIPDDDKW
jgi:methionine synthase II (cobalamin-independent)